MHIMRLAYVGLAVTVVSCDPAPSGRDLIFVDGRAVAPSGDTLLAYTMQGQAQVIVYDTRTGEKRTHGSGDLTSPHQVQRVGARWYVSDVVGGRPSIAVFSADWTLERRIDLDGIASGAHQFAVLEGDRVVVEAPDARLVSLEGDSVVTFAVTQQGTRSSLLVAGHGGVLHAVPGKTMTLYNAQGNVRWRQEWYWNDAAFATDLCVDTRGRIHVLAGEDYNDLFVAFTISSVSGEVVRWSQPGPAATFVVSRLGEIIPDSADVWRVRPSGP